jgi:hypothetical protein
VKADASQPLLVKQHPKLNLAADTWVVPVEGTRGSGTLEGPEHTWRITVLRAFFGTDITDDVCSGPVQPMDRAFAAMIYIRVSNEKQKLLVLHPRNFFLRDDHGATYRTDHWADPLLWGDLTLKAKDSRSHYLSYVFLPRGEHVYSLMLRWNQSRLLTIGTYRVIPNGHKPCVKP